MLVKCMQISTPVVQETTLDLDLWDLLLSYLLLANEQDGQAMVIINSIVLHAVIKERFQFYHE